MKVCTHCKVPKDLTNFHRRAASRDGYHAWCKLCHKDYCKVRRQTNPEVARKHSVRNVIGQRERRIKNNQFLTEYRSTHPCVDCGEADPEVLDFDHVRGVKRANVYNLGLRGCSIATILAEIAKCEVRCANCHRRITRRREREAIRRGEG